MKVCFIMLNNREQVLSFVVKELANADFGTTFADFMQSIAEKADNQNDFDDYVSVQYLDYINGLKGFDGAKEAVENYNAKYNASLSTKDLAKSINFMRIRHTVQDMLIQCGYLDGTQMNPVTVNQMFKVTKKALDNEISFNQAIANLSKRFANK